MDNNEISTWLERNFWKLWLVVIVGIVSFFVLLIVGAIIAVASH